MSFRNRVVRTAIAGLFALGVSMAAASSASAAVIYDFSLEANGDVGPVHVVLRFNDFLGNGSFVVVDPSHSAVQEFSVSAPLDPDSVAGVDVAPDATRFGIAAYALGSFETLLLTVDYPTDFFVFDRTPTQTGTFTSTGGLVVSDLNLDSRTPTATLTVTEVVPEPATVLLFGVAAMGAVVRARKRRR